MVRMTMDEIKAACKDEALAQVWTVFDNESNVVRTITLVYALANAIARDCTYRSEAAPVVEGITELLKDVVEQIVDLQDKEEKGGTLQ